MKPFERFKALQEKFKDDPDYVAEGVLIDLLEQVVSEIDRRGWNQKQFAAALGCSDAYVSKILSGSENLTIRTISEVATVLGCSLKIALSPVSRPRSRMRSATVR